MYQCPDCESTNLSVSVSTVMTLVQTDEGIETVPDEYASDDEWNNDSEMVCNDCGKINSASVFDVGLAGEAG